MALPDHADQWPPENHRTAYADYQVWDAWYTGSVDQLETLYSTTRLTQAAGIWGQVKRTFFGTPNPGNQSQRPVKLHIPLPAEIARMSSAVLYGEMPKIRLEHGTAEQNTRLTDLLDDGAHATLLEGGELGAALSGSFLRVSWDVSAVPDKPFLTAVAPDAAVPDFRFGRLVGVTFWTDLATVPGHNGSWKLLERHEPGTIEWGLYFSESAGALGRRVPLPEHPATEHLAKVVNADAQVETGSDLLTAVYVPNVKPNRSHRKDPVAGNLGRSDFDGVDGMFDALDETYTSWQRDIRLGKARVLIAKELLDAGKPGEGASFNADREIFTNLEGGLGALNGGTQAPIEQVQFAIRYQEHAATAKDLIVRIFAACGYSPQTFGEASGLSPRTITATEVDSREKLTMMTRGVKVMYARPQVQHITAALLDVDAYHFGAPGRGPELPEVEWPDALAPSIDALATTLQLLRAADAASTEVLVEMLHPDWEEKQVADEVARINAQQPPALPDPMVIRPGQPDNSPDDGSDGGQDPNGPQDFGNGQ